MNLKTLFDGQDPVIIDVREPFEFQGGSAPGAINIPLGQVPGKIDFIRERHKPVIMFCRSGMRSGQAVAFLQQTGLRNVYNAGGLEDMLQLLSQVSLQKI